MQRTLVPLVMSLALIALACGSDAAEPGTSTNATTTTTSSPTSADPRAAIAVDELFDGEGPRDALVEGFVVWDAASARLCAVLMESFPPQCGSPAVVIANPDALTVELQSEQDVRWTDAIVALDGRFDGDGFTLATGS